MQDNLSTSTLASALAREQDKILACVHCGLCLEACPTYVATGDENDGPRGRIYLMRAVEEGRLANTSTAFERHIDRCLGCRACEAVCPAGVEYGQLLEAARAELSSARVRPGWSYKLLRLVLRHVWLKPARLKKMFRFGRWLRDKGIGKLLLQTNIARAISPRFEFALLLLEGSKPLTWEVSSHQRAGTRRGDDPGDREQITLPVDTNSAGTEALLFRGCVTEGLFGRVNDATVRVLETNGYKVSIPPAQVCCGALHAHAGDLDGARKLARRNIDVLGSDNGPIVSNAGGCGAMLVSYGHLLANDAEYADRARRFSARVRDVGQQLASAGFRNGAAIGFERVTYDTSCHLLHGQHAANDSLQMLWAIPNLNFALLKDSDVCCGGAGVYNLLETELSGAVLDQKLDHVEATGAEIVATGNPGCQMQMAAGARLAGIKVGVCHPVELLDQSYRRAGFYD